MKDYIERNGSGAARSVRILAEYMSALESFERIQNPALVTVFGSARLGDNSPSVQLADRLGRACVAHGYGVVTGGSSGVMIAANRGASEEAIERNLPVEDYSVGCAITLPFEEGGNKFLGTQTDFHYFFIRKFFLVAYSKAFFFVEGGSGTRDELWELFCLVQTGKMPIHPLVALGDGETWKTLRADLAHMAKRGTISEADRNILQFADTPEAALELVDHFYARVARVDYDKERHTIDFYLREKLPTTALDDLHQRFASSLNGLEWSESENRLSTSQFDFRSYATLYDIVAALNELI